MSRAARDPLLRAKQLAIKGLQEEERKLVITALNTVIDTLLRAPWPTEQRQVAIDAYLTLKRFRSAISEAALHLDPHDQDAR
jgi:hypothetical protein